MKIFGGLIALFLIAVWVFWPCLHNEWHATAAENDWIDPTKTDKLGQFGDMFGALNALFTGLTLAGALIAISMQASSQREQSRQYADAQRDQRKAAQINALGILLDRINRLMEETKDSKNAHDLQSRQ